MRVTNADQVHIKRLAKALISHPNYSLTIMANVGISSTEAKLGEFRAGFDAGVRDQTGFFIDNKGTVGTAGQAMLGRGKALRDALIDLGVRESQLNVGFGGVIIDSDRASFNLRKN